MKTKDEDIGMMFVGEADVIVSVIKPDPSGRLPFHRKPISEMKELDAWVTGLITKTETGTPGTIQIDLFQIVDGQVSRISIRSNPPQSDGNPGVN